MHISSMIHNPLARKRWRRFARRRRAVVSLQLLLVLYGLSLVAELLCNDRPLVVRFNGRTLFPIARFYPEDTFLANGRFTRPDYARLRTNPVFTRNPDNRMVFPPVPFGPNTSIDPESLREEERVTAVFLPTPRVGSANIDASLTITRATACGFFFGVPDDAVAGMSLADAWPLTPAQRAAIAARLRNEPAPALSESLTSRHDSSRRAVLSLSAFRPRSRPPRDVRLTFREPDTDTAAKAARMSFRRPRSPVEAAPPAWESLRATNRTLVLARVAQRFDRPVPDLSIAEPDGSSFRVRFDKNDIAWPHPPVRGHWLGIDSAGRDVLARILYGMRISMTFGLLLVLASMTLGVLIGAVQGFHGGGVDLAGQRFIEIWSALPFLYVMILMGSLYGPSFTLLLVCYALFRWIGISYYARAEFLRLRGLPFVDAARCLGVPSWRIMVRHVLPNAMTPVITFFPFSLVGAIGSLAALDYLGFGLPPPTPSWGEMLHQAQQFRWAWWLILYPSLALFTVMLLGVFVGEGVRDAFDPRPLSRIE